MDRVRVNRLLLGAPNDRETYERGAPEPTALEVFRVDAALGDFAPGRRDRPVPLPHHRCRGRLGLHDRLASVGVEPRLRSKRLASVRIEPRLRSQRLASVWIETHRLLRSKKLRVAVVYLVDLNNLYSRVTTTAVLSLMR